MLRESGLIRLNIMSSKQNTILSLLFLLFVGLFASIYLLYPPLVLAVDSLTVNCSDSGDFCIFADSGTSTSSKPLFSVSDLAPGDSTFRQLKANNNRSTSCGLVLNADNKLTSSIDLATVLRTVIYEPAGSIFFGDYDFDKKIATNDGFLFDLYTDTNLSLGTLAANSSLDLIWLMTLDGLSVSNEFQGQSAKFDFDVSFTCAPLPTLTPTPTTEPSVDTTPAPTLTPIPADTDDTADDSDDTDSSTTSTSPTPTQDTLAPPAPAVAGVQFFGDSELELDELSDGLQEEGQGGFDQTGDTLGAKTSCSIFDNYIPWILLLAQLLGLLIVEYLNREPDSKVKYPLLLLTTGLSIILFYLLRQCSCYEEASLLLWLCKWFWIVSLAETVSVRLISYFFIEVVEE